jgi:nitrite reductase/ring-hydroxylating ferredoxin subunit
MACAPRADRLPVFPASWYLFGAMRELRHGPVSRDLLGRRLVAYRTAAGRAVVLEARCSHLGADLGEGAVVGDDIQCAFHNWRYGPDGRCTCVPALTHVPLFARQRAYPAVERHGYLFCFNGPEPLFPLPFFWGAQADDFAAARPLRFRADCPWHMVNGNSFDVQHFQAGHDRQLVGEPVVDCPHRFARRIRMTFAVSGRSFFDRLLRRFVGDKVEVSMTNWGGSIVVVTGDFRRTRSQLITFIEPLDAQRCIQNVLVFARKSRLPLLGAVTNPLRLGIRRLFTHGFMAEEFRTLAGIRYNPGGLLECDRLMIDFFDWVADLPQAAVERRTVGPLLRPEESLP